MKRIVIICIVCAIVAIGMATAEPGIPKVNEVQGLTTSTTAGLDLTLPPVV